MGKVETTVEEIQGKYIEIGGVGCKWIQKNKIGNLKNIFVYIKLKIRYSLFTVIYLFLEGLKILVLIRMWTKIFRQKIFFKKIFY